MKRTILIIIVLFVLSCKNKDTKPSPKEVVGKPVIIDSNIVFLTDSELYVFMNLIIDSIISDSNLLNSDPIKVDINNCGFSFDLGIPDDKNFIASEYDSVDIVYQLNNIKNKKWIANKLKQFSLESRYSGQYWNEYGRFDWDKFKKDGNKGFIGLSVPIFNLSRTKAVIKTNFSSAGVAGGQTYWLAKKGKAWSILRWRADWIT